MRLMKKEIDKIEIFGKYGIIYLKKSVLTFRIIGKYKKTDTKPTWAINTLKKLKAEGLPIPKIYGSKGRRLK